MRGSDTYGSMLGRIRRRFGFWIPSLSSSGLLVRFRVDEERGILSARRWERRTSPSSPPERTSIAAPVAFLTCKYPLTSCNASLDINHILSPSSPSFTTTEQPLSDFRRGRQSRGEAVASVRPTEGDGRTGGSRGKSFGADARLQEYLAVDLLVARPTGFRRLGKRSARAGRSASEGELSRRDADEGAISLPFPFDLDDGGGESDSLTRLVVQEAGSTSCSARVSKDFDLRRRLIP